MEEPTWSSPCTGVSSQKAKQQGSEVGQNEGRLLGVGLDG